MQEPIPKDLRQRDECYTGPLDRRGGQGQGHRCRGAYFDRQQAGRTLDAHKDVDECTGEVYPFSRVPESVYILNLRVENGSVCAKRGRDKRSAAEPQRASTNQK